jgi:hypothetical protein
VAFVVPPKSSFASFFQAVFAGWKMKPIRVTKPCRSTSIRRAKRRAWIQKAILQGTLLAGLAGAWVASSSDALAQEAHRGTPPRAWREAGPWRAIGITPRKPQIEVPQNLDIPSMVRSASALETLETPSGSDASESNHRSEQPVGVVNAIATTQSRQPSLVKAPSMKIELTKEHDGATSPQVSQDFATSRSVGAKVRLSEISLIETPSSEQPNSGVAMQSSATNASNLRVTRSGDITAETPVKVNFNQQRILALPAFPSPESPYAETGIEIPVRVEAVAQTVQSIIETQTPSADLPAIGITPALEMELGTQTNRPPMLETPEPILPAEGLSFPGKSDQHEESGPQASGVLDAINAPAIAEASIAEASSAEASRADEPAAELAEPRTADPDAGSIRETGPRGNGPVEVAPTIVPLPNIEATADEIQAISKLSRSTQPNTEGVLSQPGDQVLITTGPLVIANEIDPAEKVVLETQAIRALQVTGTISRLHVVDSSVCQVVCNANRLFIVGDQTGETTVEVQMGKSHKPMYVKVVVQRPWARGKSASVSLEQMQAIVTRLAPNADVTVQPTEEGSLIVKGFAENNQQAKKVLEAIRKMVLVPVIDQVEIR